MTLEELEKIIELLKEEFGRVRELEKVNPRKAQKQLRDLRRLSKEVFAESVNDIPPGQIEEAAKIISGKIQFNKN